MCYNVISSEILGNAEDRAGLCAHIITTFSFLLFLVTIPVSLCMCVKVNLNLFPFPLKYLL